VAEVPREFQLGVGRLERRQFLTRQLQSFHVQGREHEF
jgi:hypothetical protein